MSDDLVRYARGRGSDASDARDAGHEAAHALMVEIEDWGRESIHEALSALSTAERADSEVIARATEWAVCDLLCIEYRFDTFYPVAIIEGIRCGSPLGPDFYDRVVRMRRDGHPIMDAVIEITKGKGS